MRAGSYVFGLGTGRCGTHSLAKLLNTQPGASFGHEFGCKALMSWEYSQQDFDRACRLVNERIGNVVGEVAFYLLNYVDALREVFPGAKFVCMRREREQVVQSFERWIERVPEAKRHWWLKKPHPVYKPCAWDRCFAKYEFGYRVDCIRQWWTDYNQKLDHYLAVAPEAFYLMPTEDLNDEVKTMKMLKFCGFEAPRYARFHDCRT